MKRKIYKKAIYVIASVLFFYNTSVAQEENVNPLDTLTNTVRRLNDDMYLLKKMRISGYLQTQFQMTDSAGAKSVAGGDFPARVDKRFAVRRGRIKFTYANDLTQYVLQIDVTEKGVGIKDAYLKVTEPFFNAFSLQAGVFDRPFGFEISYSSSMRESPERSRLYQTIFPGERDLGAKIVFQPPKTSPWNFLKIEGGMFNGTGSTASDFDYRKDFIGNIGISKTTHNEKITYAARASYYNGGVINGTKFLYNDIGTLANGNKGFIVDSTATNKNKISQRTYIGADAQLSIQFPFGISTLRGEYIQGRQPASSSSSSSPSSSTVPTTDTYIRNFNGCYVYFLQNIFQTKHQLVVKYDWYDPNTDVSGDEIGKPGTKLTKTDLKYSTIGLGWVYRYDTNLKLTAYVDLVTNETSKNLSGYSKDLIDNVFTLRLQYKF